MQDVIIIGAGIAGLACGVELCRSGLRVTVLESGDTAGGRARSWTDQHTGDVVDIGPHRLHSGCSNMLAFLTDLGTKGQIVWQTGKVLTLVDRPQPVDIHMHKLPSPFQLLPSLLKSPQVSKRDLLSNRKLIWQMLRLSRADLNELDAISADDYIRKSGVSERFIDWFWRSACMSIMNVPLQHCSAAALIGFFRIMLGKSGYQIGFAAAGLAELYVPAAIHRIEQAGGQVLTNSAAASIAQDENGVNTIALADGRTLHARNCVACLPPKQLSELLPIHWQRDHAIFGDLSKWESSPYISTYLWFDRKLTDQRFWARVWRPTNLNYDSYDLSNIRPDWAKRNSVIASNIIYSHRAASMTDQQIIATTITELAAYLPGIISAKLKHARVHRIPMAVPAAYIGSEALRPDNETPVKGLVLAGDWTRTGLPPSMESAARSGFLAAEKILEQQGRPRKIAKPLPAPETFMRWVGRI